MLFHLLFISAVVCLSCGKFVCLCCGGGLHYIFILLNFQTHLKYVAHHPFHDDHDEEATKIVGGRDATIYEFPWQVSVLNTNRGQPPTGGALISRYAVLTVAHAPTILQVDRVRIGSTYSDKGGYIRHIRRVVIHPNFNSSTGDNDIAIIILKNPVYYSRRVQPVALPRYRHDLAVNATVTVSGWGWFDYDHGIHPEILQAGDARIIDQKACAGVYSELTENMFCAVGLNAGRFGPCRVSEF